MHFRELVVIFAVTTKRYNGLNGTIRVRQIPLPDFRGGGYFVDSQRVGGKMIAGATIMTFGLAPLMTFNDNAVYNCLMTSAESFLSFVAIQRTS